MIYLIARLVKFLKITSQYNFLRQMGVTRKTSNQQKTPFANVIKKLLKRLLPDISMKMNKKEASFTYLATQMVSIAF